ncbi:MAG: GGDEF domain-containing protein [Myxococcota bacterium]
MLDRHEVARLGILRNADLDAIWPLLVACPVRELGTGDLLLARGEPNDTMYLLLSGALEVRLERTTEPVARLDAGESVGELSVIDDTPASAYVLATSPSRLLAVQQEIFWLLVRSSHVFAQNLLVLLAHRIRATNSTVARTAAQKEKAERESLVDELTQLQNRRWLEETGTRLAQRLLHDGAALSLLLFDLDHFKRVNDTYGHLVGDRVLRQVAELLRFKLRPSDIGVRYGGEELLVLLPNTPLVGAQIAAERMRRYIAELHTRTEGEPLPAVTVSVGVAQLRAEEALLVAVGRADEALYRAKHAGRDRVEVAT